MARRGRPPKAQSHLRRTQVSTDKAEEDKVGDVETEVITAMDDQTQISGAHTVGFSHCNKFSNRIYGFKSNSSVDPTLNPQYATQLQQMCPKNVDPRIAVSLDPVTPGKFDNWYYKDLMQGKGLLSSDQVLYIDPRTKALVKNWAQDTLSFENTFAKAMIKLGRVGVKSGKNGNIRLRCDAFN